MPENWTDVGHWSSGKWEKKPTLESSKNVNEYIYIDDSAVTINANGVVLQDDAVAFAAKFFRNTEAISDIFFPGLRWRSRDGLSYLIERPPEVIEIFFTPSRAAEAHSTKEQIISLPVPWTLWLFSLSAGSKQPTGASIWARPAQITSPDDLLYCLPLPNMDHTGYHCFGDSYNDYINNTINASLVESFSTYITTFWNSGFNLDLREHIFEIIPNFPHKMGGTDYAERTQQWLDHWSSLSLEQALELDFRRTPHPPIGQILAARDGVPFSAPTTPAQYLMRFR